MKTVTGVPLSILDLAPIPAGGTVRDALRNTINLARRAEAVGYRRYWLAEHHLAPGVASSAPQILIQAVAAATTTLRVGSGAVQTGHWTPLAIAEQFGTIEALHPGRIDLGLGRSGQRRNEPARHDAARENHEVNGLLIPKPFDSRALTNSPQVQAMKALLQQPGAQTPDFADQVDDLTALLDGTYRSPSGHRPVVVPGTGADLELWILGSSGGQSAHVAGERGLPFAANYHVAPAAVLEAVEAYRAAFKPSDVLDEPYVMVSADVVVAPTDEEARHLASPYPLWVHSIRSELAAIPYPSPEQAAAHQWTDEAWALVQDRVDTQFVGSPETVAERLDTLQWVTGADELLVTTITHDHADRVRSFELLARQWRAQRSG
jgi:alkanesulfonate monooxygenase SsuD/methylene tetrahydromethanopterin reductase-like flavin-dependent oxidoreductase (luciferase family)